MKRIMVRYRVKSDRADENRRYVKNVFSELEKSAPDGIRYASFVQPDGVSFVHIASIETDDGSNPLAELEAFKDFQEEIKDRCDDAPTTSPLIEIGSYRFF